MMHRNKPAAIMTRGSQFVPSLEPFTPQIWDASPFSIVVTDYDAAPELRRIVYVNPAFSDLTGFAAEEVLGKLISAMDRPEPDLRRSAECEAILSSRKTCESTFFHYRKDGSKYLSRETVAPFIEPDGSARFLMMIEMAVSSIEHSPLDDEIRDGVFVGLTLPMPLQEYPSTPAPRHLTSHPELDVLRDLWTKIRGDRKLPRRGEFDLGQVKRWASHLSIATVTFDGRFKFRLFGTELTRLYGRDLTGSNLDELTPKDLWSGVIQHYKEVVRTRQPLFAPISIANGRWYNEVSRLLLPLAGDGDGDAVSFVMAVDYQRLQ
jgi:PAS domain S-box-containing protein